MLIAFRSAHDQRPTGDSEVLSALKTMLTAAEADIRVRTRVNRMHNLLGPERIDGLVINLQRDVAYVAWPNGETTVESTRYLVPIIA